MAITLEEIQVEFDRYNAKFGGSSKKFPYDSTPHNCGGHHLEISDDGKMALVGTDRGYETTRKETYSLDELMYWMFRKFSESRGWDYELKNRQQGADSRRMVFRKALEEMEKLSVDWRDWLHREQQEILRTRPFHDRAT